MRINIAEQNLNNLTVAELKDLVCLCLEDGKALDVVSIDLKDKTDIADFMVIASGTSNRHTSSLAYKLIEKLKQSNSAVLSTEGMVQGDWVLVDTGDIVVHIFRQELREHYNLEKMWSVEAPQMCLVY